MKLLLLLLFVIILNNINYSYGNNILSELNHIDFDATPIEPHIINKDNTIHSHIFPPTPWNQLRVTWHSFDKLPFSRSSAESEGWILKQSCDNTIMMNNNIKNVECSITSLPWVGYRYQKDNEPLFLIFGEDGRLAGIQVGVITQPSQHNEQYYTQCGNLKVQTVYTRLVSSICSASSSGDNPIGDRAGLRISTTNVMEFPAKESNVVHPWDAGKCFWTMGDHKWYNISPNMNCDDFFPIFLLYNRGALNGFGFNIGGHQTSSRWEHPPSSAIKLFFPSDVMPQCLLSFPDGYLSTMHVYFTNPYLDLC